VIVAAVRGLAVRGDLFLVPLGEIGGQERLSDASPAVRGVRGKETQVVVVGEGGARLLAKTS
jgi:hypothetical protein